MSAPTAGTITVASPLSLTATLPFVPTGITFTAAPNPNSFSTSADYPYSLTLTDSSGVFLVDPTLAETAVVVTGQNTGTLTLAGTASAIQSELALISFIAATSGSSSLTLTAVETDPLGQTSTPATIDLVAATAPAAASFTWAAASGSAWNVASDWTVGAGAATRVPGKDDSVILPSDTAAATISGVGAGGSLSVFGSYVVSGEDDIAGAVAVSGTLGLLGPGAVAPAALFTGNVTLTGTASQVDVTIGTWINTGSFAVGGGSAFLRGFGTLETGSLSVGGGGELVVDPAAFLDVTGALSLNGLLVALGTLSAGSITFGAGSESIVQGTMTAAAISVAAGALLDGAGVVGAVGGTIVNNGTIEGAVALSPLDLESAVGGTGSLLIDPGGGLQLGAAVSTGQTVTIAPGVTPIYLDANGAGGGVLVLTDLAAFQGTIDGFGPGDRLVVAPAGNVTIASAALVGNTLELKNGSGTIVDSLAVNAALLPAGTVFEVEPNETQDVFSTLNVPANAVEIVATPPTAAPQLTASGGIRLQTGLEEPIPLISAYDPAGYQAGDTFTLKLTANTGTLTELLSMPLFLSKLISAAESSFSGGASTLGSLFDPRPVGDGSYDFGTLGGLDSDSPSEPLSVSGTGTETLTISSNDLLLLNLQSALVDYQAATTTGNGTITATFTDGTNTTTTTVPVSVVSGTGSAFTWIGTSTASALNPANWSSSAGTGLLPDAGDSVSLGAGSYAITGDFSASLLTVTGHALTQGAIFVGNNGGATTALTIGNGGILGSAGFLYVNGNAVVGTGGAGELDTVGLINNIAGNLTIGGTSAGYLQNGGLLAVNDAILVGVGAPGTLDLTSAPVSSGGIGLSGELLDNSATIGVGAGQIGLAIAQNDSWDSDANVVVGDSGTGILQLASSGFGDTEINADNLILGQSAGGTGTVVVGADSEVATTGLIEVGAAGSGTLVVETNGELRLAQSQAANGPEFAGTLDIGGSTTGPGAVDVLGGVIYGTSINVGDGGAGTLVIDDGASVTLNFNLGTTDPSTLGTLNVSGAASSYGIVDLVNGSIDTGTADIGGTVMVSANASLGTSTLNVQGGTITLQNATLQPTSFSIATNGLVAGYGDLSAGSAGAATIANSGTIEAMGGTLDIQSAISAASGHGTLEIVGGGTFDLFGAVDASQSILFAGAGGLAPQPQGFTSSSSSSAPTLTTFAPTIAGFGGGDAIDFPNTSQISIVAVSNGHVTLDVDQTAGMYAQVVFSFAGSYNAGNFKVMPDTTNGQELAYVACFATGTRILTATGETPVETLRPGDIVVTASGQSRPVVWIGHRAIDCRRHPRPAAISPVRVAADAFGPGAPSRPLFLSPDHAVFVDGVLIPVGSLVDGDALTQPSCDRVEYWHVELERHDVLLADGLPCESYLDTGNREVFANASVVSFMPADFGPPSGRPLSSGCAPLVSAGPKIEAVRARLARTSANRETVNADRPSTPPECAPTCERSTAPA